MTQRIIWLSSAPLLSLPNYALGIFEIEIEEDCGEGAARQSQEVRHIGQLASNLLRQKLQGTS
jgi:hypothetical protein